MQKEGYESWPKQACRIWLYIYAKTFQCSNVLRNMFAKVKYLSMELLEKNKSEISRYKPLSDHSLLQSLVRLRSGQGASWRSAPAPCCAPSSYESLDILHLDDQDPTKLKVTNWKNIKVSQCACAWSDIVKLLSLKNEALYFPPSLNYKTKFHQCNLNFHLIMSRIV